MSKDADKPSEEIVERLRELVSRNATQVSISRKAGKADSWLGRILGGELRPELDRIGEIAEQIGMPLRWVLDWCFEEQDLPASEHVLRALRKEQTLPPDRFFQSSVADLDGLVSRVDLVQEDLAVTPPHLEQIDTLRFTDRERSQKEVELQIKRLTSRPISATAVAELCLALAIWGSLQRMAHRTSDACDALCWALTTSRRFSLERTRALMIHRSAFLLRDWGEPRQAKQLLDQALMMLVRIGMFDDVARLLVDRGSLMIRLDLQSEAASDARAALRLLPADQQRFAIAAHQTLATCAASQGDVAAAIEETDRAMALLAPEQHDLCRAHIVWMKGRFLASANLHPRAIEHLQEGLDLLAEHGMPLDVALAAVDLARSLLAAGRLDELRSLASDVQALATTLRAAPEIDGVLLEFVRTVRYGQLSMHFLIESRKQLESAGAKARRQGC